MSICIIYIFIIVKTRLRVRINNKDTFFMFLIINFCLQKSRGEGIENNKRSE